MMRRDEVVASARSWLKTPFHHQGRLKGVGVDCVGLAIEVAKASGADLSSFDLQHNYPQAYGYADLISQLQKGLVEVPMQEARPGDILLFQIYKEPQHIGIMTGPDTMIHSVDKFGVVEVTLDPMWQSRLISVWRHPDMED